MKRTAITFTVSHWENAYARAMSVTIVKFVHQIGRSTVVLSFHILVRRGLRRPFHYTLRVYPRSSQNTCIFFFAFQQQKAEYECARETIRFIVVWFAQRAFHLIEITFMQIWCVSLRVYYACRVFSFIVSLCHPGHTHSAHKTNARHSRLKNTHTQNDFEHRARDAQKHKIG